MSLTAEREIASEPQHAPARAATTPLAAGLSQYGKEYLAFRLGDEEYGIDILKVQEIRSYEAPTRIAGAPPFMKGVINLRGVIVPVADLRVSMGCKDETIRPTTCVIVLTVSKRVVGAVVDSVSDVLALTDADIKPPPEMGASVADASITGLATVGQRMLMLIDIEQYMSSSAMQLVD